MGLLENNITAPGAIQNLIPQKQPFVMVDNLVHYTKDKIISGLRVSEDNLFVKNNVFEAPGLIENMAQTVALHTGYQYFLKQEAAPIGYIGAIKSVSIHSLPLVGQELTTTVHILHDILGVTLVRATVECEGVLVASSEMKTVLANQDQ